MAVGVGEFRVDVEVANSFAIGHAGEVLVDLVNEGNDGQVVVSGENCGGDDGGARGLFAAEGQERLQAAGDVLDFIGAAELGTHIVDAGEEDDDFWVYAIELAMLHT